MQKQALAKALGILAGAGANAYAWDRIAYNGNPNWETDRAVNAVLNGLAGAASVAGGVVGKDFSQKVVGAGLPLAFSPFKTYYTVGAKEMPKTRHALEAIAGNMGNVNNKVDVNMSPGTKALLAALATAAVGGVGYLGFKGTQALDAAQRKNEGGRIRLKLPTRDQYDQETELEVPVDKMNISDAMMGKLRRDLRRKLISETRERTKTKDKGLKAIDKLDDRALLGAEEDPLASDPVYKAASALQDTQAWMSLLGARAGGGK